MRTLKTSENIRGYSTIETLLSIGIGLYLYQHAKRKKLINFLSDLNISANYKRVILHQKKDIANYIEMRQQENNGVFIPAGFQKNRPTFFAIG